MNPDSVKVFYIISDACRVSGGAERAASVMLQKVQKHYGYSCEMLSAHPVPFEQVRDGVRLRGFRDEEDLNAITLAERPDIIIASLTDAVPAFKVAARHGVPRILSIHGYEFSPPTEEERRQWSMHPGFVPMPQDDIDFVLNSADHIFSCSPYLQAFLRDRLRLDTEVLPNDWNINEVMIDQNDLKEGTYITGICSSPHKGIGIILELARHFTDAQFMLVGDVMREFPPKLVGDIVACGNIDLPGHIKPRDFLASSKLVLVPSQLPEPFGRIAVEAMVNGVPVLASRNGGLGEIVGPGPMGVDDFTNIEAWKECLRAQLDGQRVTPENVITGRARARQIMDTEPLHILAQTIETLCATSTPHWDETSIAFVGGLDGMESNTIVNAAWARELIRRGYGIEDSENTDIATANTVIIHDYSKDFEDFVPPKTGHYIAVRTSDFGPYPQNWARKIENEFDQLWVYTEWIAEQALASGIPRDMVRVVPLGVNPDLFRPDGPVSSIIPPDTFTFLFVGGAVLRKGIDTLIKAYQSSFSAQDDVALVIKGNSQNLHYRGFREVDRILGGSAAKDPPKIIHIDDHLHYDELAALFRTCDVGVFPYRAEGFALPIAEAMASGTPSIVPNFGACLDFCSDKTSFFVPARRIKIPYPRTFKLAAGFVMEVQSVDFCEIQMEDLARTLRAVFDAGRPALEHKRKAGLNVVQEKLNWATSVDHIEACLRELQNTVPRRIAAKRKEEAIVYRRETALREMAMAAEVKRVSRKT
jgi:glycosyltransferase involved in cell wall biosynthesis